MSVSILSSVDISKMARFAEANSIGCSSLVAAVLSNQNVKTFNSRYGESITSSFELVYSDYTAEEVYDIALYWLSNSWHELEGSRACELIKAIFSNAAHPVQGEQSFSPIIGKPVYYGHRKTLGYVSSADNPYAIELVSFNRDSQKWFISRALRSECYEVTDYCFCFSLSVEQLTGLKLRIGKIHDAEVMERNKLIEARNKIKAEFDSRFKAIVPAGSKSVIVAQLLKSECGDNDDYYGSSTQRRVVLAFSTHKRNLFPEMRKAALNFKSTEFLYASDEKAEHRENYSMGRGTYLTEGCTYSGWMIRKEVIWEGSIREAEILDIDYTKKDKIQSKPKKQSRSDVSPAPVEGSGLVEFEGGIIKSRSVDGLLSFTPKSKLERSEVNSLLSLGFKSDESSDEWLATDTPGIRSATAMIFASKFCGLF